jgi:hypothetical protein
MAVGLLLPIFITYSAKAEGNDQQSHHATKLIAQKSS